MASGDFVEASTLRPVGVVDLGLASKVPGLAVVPIDKTGVPLGTTTNPSQVALTNAITLPGGALTDRSGSIAAPNTSQQVAALNATRQYLFIQNISTAILWLNFGGAANQDQPSIRLDAGASIWWDVFVPTGSVNLEGALGVSSQKFVCKEG